MRNSNLAAQSALILNCLYTNTVTGSFVLIWSHKLVKFFLGNLLELFFLIIAKFAYLHSDFRLRRCAHRAKFHISHRLPAISIA